MARTQGAKRGTALRVALIAPRGLWPLVEQELALRKIAIARVRSSEVRNHFFISFDIEPRLIRRLEEMRTVEDVFVLIYEGVKVERYVHLERLVPANLKPAIVAALPFKFNERRRGKRSTRFAVFVKQDRDQAVYRRDIAATIAHAIEDRFERWRVSEPADVELWAFYEARSVSLGLRLTDITFRQRRYRTSERPGSLRPTIAAALALASEPSARDVVLDPMCGSGTVLIERGLVAEAKELRGIDLDPDAVKLARANLRSAGVEGEVAVGDAREVRPERYSRILCNLPFGKRFKAGGSIPALYRDLLRSWREMLQENGSVTVLTSERAALRSAAERAGFQMEQVVEVDVQGIPAIIARLTR